MRRSRRLSCGSNVYLIFFLTNAVKMDIVASRMIRLHHHHQQQQRQPQQYLLLI